MDIRRASELVRFYSTRLDIKQNATARHACADVRCFWLFFHHPSIPPPRHRHHDHYILILSQFLFSTIPFLFPSFFRSLTHTALSLSLSLHLSLSLFLSLSVSVTHTHTHTYGIISFYRLTSRRMKLANWVRIPAGTVFNHLQQMTFGKHKNPHLPAIKCK